MSSLSIHGSQCCGPSRKPLSRPQQVALRWLLPALTGVAALAAAVLLVVVGLVQPAASGARAAARTVELPRVVIHARRLPPAAADCPVPTEPASACPTPSEPTER